MEYPWCLNLDRDLGNMRYVLWLETLTDSRDDTTNEVLDKVENLEHRLFHEMNDNKKSQEDQFETLIQKIQELKT